MGFRAKEKKLLLTSVFRTPDHPSVALVTLVTKLSRLPSLLRQTFRYYD